MAEIHPGEFSLKERIKRSAVEHFDKRGYHGTTIRSIAGDVGCSLPMVYYYYNSKKDLFHEIVKQDFFDLVGRLALQLKMDDVIEFYTQYVCRIGHLSEYDKRIYRLGIKVYLTFDGDDELVRIMDEWERSILPRHCQLVLPHLKRVENGIAVVRTLVHLLENLIESIVVKNRNISEEEVREELSVVLGNLI